MTKAILLAGAVGNRHLDCQPKPDAHFWTNSRNAGICYLIWDFPESDERLDDGRTVRLGRSGRIDQHILGCFQPMQSVWLPYTYNSLGVDRHRQVHQYFMLHTHTCGVACVPDRRNVSVFEVGTHQSTHADMYASKYERVYRPDV